MRTDQAFKESGGSLFAVKGRQAYLSSLAEAANGHSDDFAKGTSRWANSSNRLEDRPDWDQAATGTGRGKHARGRRRPAAGFSGFTGPRVFVTIYLVYATGINIC